MIFVGTKSPILVSPGTGCVGSHHFEVDPVPCPWGAKLDVFNGNVGDGHFEEAIGDMIHKIQGAMPFKKGPYVR